MKPRKHEQEKSKVFILGFTGTEVYYSAREGKILSRLAPVPRPRKLVEADNTSHSEGSTLRDE